jgi:hypothetical protein
MRYRPDQSRGEYDYDLRYSDGTIAAVEVTASRDQAVEETMAAIFKKDFFIPRKKSINDWLVHPVAGARINRIWSQVDEYLAAIEAAGLNRFFVNYDYDSPPVASIYNDLKIEWGNITDTKGKHVVAYPVQGKGLVLAEDIQQALEAEANKDDNKIKLGKAGTDERHLFVYVDPYSLAWDALVDGVVPEQASSLPSEITHVWAVTRTRLASEFMVWRAKGSQGWQNLGTISVNPSA